MDQDRRPDPDGDGAALATPEAASAATLEAAGSSRTRQPTVRFLAASIGAFLAFAATFAVFVLTEQGQRFENLALFGAALRSPADRQESLDHLSQLSLISFAFAILFIFLFVLARRRFALGVSIVLVMGGSAVVAELLKIVLPRPALVTGQDWILRNSFPSGTATIAAGIGVALLLASPDRLRWLALVIGSLLAAVIGQATQISGWHRMSDAVGGVLLVVTIACLSLTGLSLLHLVNPSNRAGVSRRITAALVILGAGTVLLGALVLGISYAFPLLTIPEGASGAFVHTTLDLVGAGVTVLIFVGFGRLIEPYALGEGDTGSVGGSPAVQPG
jgi:membrane-associated phospholipid phosphatase